MGTRDGKGLMLHPIIVKHANVGETTTRLQEAILGESKSSLSDLYNTRSVSPDSSSTVQPAVQLLSVSHMKGFREEEPTVLFFGTRTHIRPYVYFVTSDILLTTEKPLVWQQEDRIHLQGLIVAALLTQAVPGVKYREYVGSGLLCLPLPSTGFVNAMGSPTKLAASELKASRMQKPASTPSSDEDESESESVAVMKASSIVCWPKQISP